MRTQEQALELVTSTLELIQKRKLPEGFPIILDGDGDVPEGHFAQEPPFAFVGIAIPPSTWLQLSDNGIRAAIAHEMANQRFAAEAAKELSFANQFGDNIIWFQTLRKMKVDAVALDYLEARQLPKESLVEWIDFMRECASQKSESVARFLREMSFQLRHHHAQALIDGRHDLADQLKLHVELVVNAISIAYSQPQLVQ